MADKEGSEAGEDEVMALLVEKHENGLEEPVMAKSRAWVNKF